MTDCHKISGRMKGQKTLEALICIFVVLFLSTVDNNCGKGLVIRENPAQLAKRSWELGKGEP